MRIRAERDELADAFGRATRAVGVRSALPILQGVLCQSSGNSLRVTGTDLEMTIRTVVEVEGLADGEVVVPARLATEAIRKMPPGAVTVGADDGEVEITGNGPTFRLREQPVEDYPRLKDPDFTGAIELDGEELERALAQVVVASSADAARPSLTGVLFEGGTEGMRLVATDSYRLAVRRLPSLQMEVAALVPARGLRDFGRTVSAPKVQVVLGEREAAFRSERGVMTLRLNEGTFPNYRQLIPDAYPNALTVDKGEILEALGRAALVAEDHIPIRLQMSPESVELTVTRQDVGGEAEQLDASYDGEPVTIAFNPRYLADGISVVDDSNVRIEIMDALKPAVIRASAESEYLYLLMPVRI